MNLKPTFDQPDLMRMLIFYFVFQLKTPLFSPDPKWNDVYQLIEEKRIIQATCLATKLINSYRAVI